MKIATILVAHENSEVYRDTLESVRTYLSEDVMVLIDGFARDQFKNENVDKIEGFRHGKSSAPVRNMALGLMEAWNRYGESVNWYCYIEYDCLIGSRDVLNHLAMAQERGYWLLGNDLRKIEGSIPELEKLCGSSGIKPHYFLGCCLFFNSRFMSKMCKDGFLTRLLEYTNFFPSDFNLLSKDPTDKHFGTCSSRNGSEKKIVIHDPSEFIYPSLAIHYGGSVKELASWDQITGRWGGNYLFYPMRFTPDLCADDPFQKACIMHPIKEANSPIRAYHRSLRKFL